MPPSVPVIVESIINFSVFPMTRCNYLLIEADEPTPDWSLGIAEQAVPIMLLGMEAIVLQPLDGQFFERPEQIEALISLIEDAPNAFSVHVDDLWLPTSVFRWEGEPANENQLYRVEAPLFSLAYRFRRGSVSQSDFVDQVKEMEGMVSYSESEHLAFRAWHEGVIKEASELYHARKREDPSMVLQQSSRDRGLTL